jgi:hypothetical protein
MMSDFEEKTGDKMIELQLTKKSSTLNLPINKLITRYIMRGLFIDDYYEPPTRSEEELMELGRKAVEKDKKRGIPPKKHNFDYFVGLLNE